MVCPLDWGLGHASRMVPVINHYRNAGYQVFIGGSGKSGALLKVTFSELPFIQLPSPEIRYASKGAWLIPSLVFQLPALVKATFREHRLIRRIVEDYHIDIVVSDNRYGLFCKKATCILVTHQVSPKLPHPISRAEYPLYFILRFLINRFHSCWVPDFSDPSNNLSGRLSHRFPMPKNARYVGILSRFSGMREERFENTGIRFEMVFIISGPEPQRKIFRDMAIHEAIRMKGRVLVITGSVENEELTGINSCRHIDVVPHLDTFQFRQAVLQADIIICRSGYSMIMDLISLGKTAILVPTPGQSEQEYLAEYLSQKGWFSHIPQSEFSLEQVLKSHQQAPCNAAPLINTGVESLPVIPLSDQKNGDHSQKSY